MPLYEYECQDCAEKFEILVRSDTKVVCPKCESATVEKCMSTFSPRMGSSAGAIPPCGIPAAAGGGCGFSQCGSGGCGFSG